jgi:predicted DNA-binding transcriptional regulator AlpA
MSDVANVMATSVAARFVGLSKSTLTKLRLNGTGPTYCKLGRRVVYRQEDLEAWLSSRTANSTTDADARLPRRLTGQHAG